jgi:sulfhydrogenase subunit gamma (sulfur reductase)
MGVRGPLGNWYPWEVLEGKNVLIVGGGFAFTTLRSSIIYMLDPANRKKFKEITVVYGARSPGMLLYKDELIEWEKRDDIDMHITVDATDDPGLEIQRGVRAAHHRAESAPGRCRQLCHRVRTAHHDQIHPAGP